MRFWRDRQLLLFLAILVLPGILVVVQGRRISVQEQELAKARIEDIRRRTAADIGQDIVTRLERIRSQEMANMPSPATSRARRIDPAVAAVGWMEGDRLLWLWDIDSTRVTSSPNPEFESALLQARRAEFADQRYERAAQLYAQAREAARQDGQRSVAALGLGRAWSHLGKMAEAAGLCRALLGVPSNAVDEDGIPVWSSAGELCAEWGVPREVLLRAAQEVEGAGALRPIQAYRLRTILETLAHSADIAIQEGATSLLQKLAARLKILEQAQKLQGDFLNLRVTPTMWQPYEDAELWLVGRAPDGAMAQPLVIAVRWETLLPDIQEDHRSHQPRAPFLISVLGEGDSLSEYLPDLRITFPEGIADSGARLNPQQSFWRLSFLVVGLLTLLGGFLLWRDMRRRAHIADLRTQFVSSVSHELKTPLTSIRMFAELLQMKPSEDPEQSMFLNTIVSESERLTRLLNNVLDFSRIERAQKAYRLLPDNLAEVVDSTVRTIQYPLSQQGFALDLNMDDKIPLVAVDRDALQQAILNLLTNAMKYSGPCRKIVVRVSTEDNHALVEVSDYGIGISENDQGRIFEKFYRVPSPENREISGTGLGLALVAHIVEGHGGSIQVKSAPGQGSRFTIRLPLMPARNGLDVPEEAHA